MDVAAPKTGLIRLPSWAAAFVALVCVAILGMSGWREWSSREGRLKAAEVEMSNLARSMTQHAEDTIDLLDASILGVVVRLETDGTGQDSLSKLRKILLARKAGLKRIRDLTIFDETGLRIATSGAPGPNVSDREYFRHHQQSPSRDVFIGPPARSRTTGDWMTTVSRRFNHPDGSFAGVVLATVGASYFSQFYRQFEVGAHSTITLLNTDGVVMARNPDNGTNGTYVGRNLSNGPLFQDPSLQSATGAYYFKSSLDGMQRVSFYQRSDRFPLVILATVEQEEVLARWRDAAISRMALVLCLVVLIAVIGFYPVRQLSRGQRMATSLAAKEANFRVLAEGSSDMVTRIGLDERLHYASPSSVRIVGWRPEQLVGTPALAGVNPEDLPAVSAMVTALKRGEFEEARITYRTRHRQKSEIWVETTLRVTREVDGEIDGVVAILRDVTQQKDLEGRLEALATEDGLTGLANRRCFDERLLEEWNRAYREKTSLSLLLIDVDQFKTYNDELGHPAGDACLRAVARVLAAQAHRVSDLAARYGGEEFALLLPNTDAAGCARIGESVRRALREACIPHAHNLPSRRVTVSLGGAICRPGNDRSAGHASLIEAADRALYAAKDGGRDRLVMSGQLMTLVATAAAAL
jgi:diguanylate cyclase (GGDEF)-like protein/PAS domain S-box-containing protein